MKYTKKALALCAIILSVTFYYSCTKDKVKVLNTQKTEISTQLKIEFSKLSDVEKEQFNSLADDLTYVKNSNILVNVSKPGSYLSEMETETIKVQTSEVSRENLNDVFPSLNSSIKILAITSLNDENDITDGLIIHYSDTEGNLKLESFNKVNGEDLFQRVDFPVNLVTQFTLDNLLFVARNAFPNRNLTTIGVTALGEIISNNKEDAVAMVDFALTYDLLTSDKYEKFANRISYSTLFRGKKAPNVDPPDNWNTCSISVHNCNNGTWTKTVCAPFQGGCNEPPDCPDEETAAALIANGLQSEHDEYESNLVDSDLYSFRDDLATSPKGQFFVHAYYSLSASFNETLDVPLLLDIVGASVEMSNFVTAMQNDDPNYVLTASDFDLFVDILESSKLNSTNSDYINIVNNLIAEAQAFKSK